MSVSPDKITLAARRVLDRCDTLAHFTETPGLITRTFLSPPMHCVHETLGGWMREAGLTVRVDGVGNLIGRLPSTDERPDAPVFLIGSHLDTVPDAGRYDGILGVLLALAVVESWGGGRRFPFAVEVIGFSDEEGVRFIPYLGSRAVAGAWDEGMGDLRDTDGKSIADALRDFGLAPDGMESATYPTGRVMGYLEAHIEQGPILEARNLPVGIVTAIAGQTRIRLRWTGQAAHAGTTPMPMRRDALVGAAEWIGLVEAHATATPDLVATVGEIAAHPNASNVIPGAVEVSLDVRHADDVTRLAATVALLVAATACATRRGLEVSVVRRRDMAAIRMSDRLRGVLSTALADERLPHLDMVSGAGHDAAILATIAPAAMLFLRSPNGGLSHHPDESVHAEDVEAALRVLLRTFERLEETPL